MLLLLGCTDGWDRSSPPPPDAETVLVEMASVHTEELFGGLRSAVEDDIGSRWELEDGDHHRGALVLPEDDENAWPDGATLDTSWSLTYRQSDSGLDTWNWWFSVESFSLPLPDMRLSGAGQWHVEDVRWGFAYYARHTWSGELSMDDRSPVPVTWEALAAGELVSVEGTVDGEAAEWVAEDAAEP